MTPSPAHPRARRRQLRGAGSWRVVWEEGESGRGGCQPPPPEEWCQPDADSVQRGDGSTLDRLAPLPTCCAGPRPTTCSRDRSSTTLPGSSGHHHHPAVRTRAHPARHPQVPAAEPGPERAAPAKVTQRPGPGVLGSYRGVGGTGEVRAQVAVELVLLGARLHGAAAGPPSTRPERALRLRRGLGLSARPRHAPRARPPPDSASTGAGPGLEA